MLSNDYLNTNLFSINTQRLKIYFYHKFYFREMILNATTMLYTSY